LEGFGLGADAERVYTALLGVEDADVRGIATVTGMGEERVRAGAAELVVLRLAHPIGRCWRAEPPEFALAGALSERQRQLDADRLALEQLAATFRRGAAGRDGGPKVHALAGRAALADALRRVQLSAEREVRALVRPPVVAVTAEDNAPVQFAQMQEGLAFRVVYDRQAASGASGEFMLQRSIEAGEQVRVADTLPVKLLMADAGLAVVSIGDESWGVSTDAECSEPVALLVTEPSLLVVLDALFERLWAEAVAIPARGAPGAKSPGVRPGQEAGEASGGGRPAPIDLQLLGLVMAGLPDRAVGAHLGVTTRTVQRRLRALLDRAGVRSRIQLVVHAVRSGWI
jgi:DNA-binding CsgD family transcriptional regulator